MIKHFSRLYGVQTPTNAIVTGELYISDNLLHLETSTAHRQMWLSDQVHFFIFTTLCKIEDGRVRCLLEKIT